MRKTKNTEGNIHNRLHGHQIHKLNMWVEQNREFVTNSIYEHSAEKASEALGFHITKFNIAHARQNCGIVSRRSRTDSIQDKTAILAAYVIEIYAKLGIKIPLELTTLAESAQRRQ